jgi:hypothetical protein
MLQYKIFSPDVTGGSFPWGIATQHEAEQTPLRSAEVKNSGAVPPLPPTSSYCKTK